MASDNGEWSYADTDEEILTRIAWYYYNDGLTQNEIGEKARHVAHQRCRACSESGRRSGIYPGAHQLALSGVPGAGAGDQGALRADRRPTWCRSFPIRTTQLTGWARLAAQFLMQRLQPDDLLAVGSGATACNTIQRLGHRRQRAQYRPRQPDRRRRHLCRRHAHGQLGQRRAPGAGAARRARPGCGAQPLRRTRGRQLCSTWRSTRATSSSASASFSAASTVVRSGYVSPDEVEPLRPQEARSATSSASSTTNAAKPLELPLHDPGDRREARGAVARGKGRGGGGWHPQGAGHPCGAPRKGRRHPDYRRDVRRAALIELED